MEKNKVAKISLSTILLIISIVVIIVMAYFIYKINNDKQIANNKVTELDNQVSRLESTVNDLQGTITNNTNKTETNPNGFEVNNSTETNSNSSETNTNSIENNTNSNTQPNESVTKTFSEDEIKNAIQNYLNLVGAREASPESLLEELGFKNLGTNAQTIEDNYVKTNIKYSEYKEKMLNYMTEQWFENNFTNYLKNVNGYLYYFNGGGTGMAFEVKSITIKGDYSDLNYIANVDNIHVDDSREQENIEFHIENYNGKCVISYCD